MPHSRRDFLKVTAAGMTVAAATPWLTAAPAFAKPPAGAGDGGSALKGAYPQAEADRIDYLSTEEGIRRTGQDPEEVKARVVRGALQAKAKREGSP